MIKNVKLGKNVNIPHPELVNLYDCEIGSGSFIGPFVEMTKGVIIGENCRIQSHSFICGGVIIGNRVFIGHGVIFTNDKHPKANNKDWIMEKTLIGDDSSIGSNSTILPVRVGKNVLVGAGTVVSKNVPDNTTVYSSYVRMEKRVGNFFLDLYHKIEKMHMDSRDLDSLLNSLPWVEKERKPDGTIVYECEIKNE